jgi:phosphohistidine swiveling domain-containing protein
VAKEELFLYNTALKYKEEGKALDEIKELEEKYWWTGLGWNEFYIKDKRYFVDSVRKTLKEHPDIGQEIMRIKKSRKDVIARKTELIEKYSLAGNFYTKVFEEYAGLHDIRKEFQMKALYACHLLIKEASNRKNVAYSDLMYYWPWEVEELLKSNKKISLKDRKKAVTVCARNKNPEFYYGENAVDIRKEEFGKTGTDITNFSGLAASLGKSVGTARVAITAAEAAKKLIKGDVLITSMTTPEFLPAMKNAAAIVTDEGGITCHAAIISRELGIPCIVGTKIATKILQDGMRIEVNANHNIIKILDKSDPERNALRKMT